MHLLGLSVLVKACYGHSLMQVLVACYCRVLAALIRVRCGSMTREILRT